MSKSFKERLIESIRDAAKYDSGNLVAPVAVLWPDPDKQWTAIIGKLQEDMPELLVLGDYSPAKRIGPALWLKCMVSRILPEANWDESLVPVIYLPGISKNDMKNLSQADPAIAPLMEYQYTGVLWTHRNGKEWTVTGFLQNREDGLFNNEIVNAVSSARISLGISCDIIKMRDKINSISIYSGSGRAVGQVENIEKLFGITKKYLQNYDAVGLSTFIKVPDQFHKIYFTEDHMINPWGGIEAMLTHSLSLEFDIPSAHSPMMSSREIMDLEVGIVEPRKAPETSSVTYLHCILKGLHRSPKLVPYEHGLNVEDISCLITPYGCIGLPTLAAIEQEIPVIAVKENKNRMQNILEDYPFKPGKLFIVDNYLEVVGVMNAIKSGISVESVRRPLANTKVINDKSINNDYNLSNENEDILVEKDLKKRIS